MSFTRQPKSNNKVGVGCLVIALLLVAVLFCGMYSASALKSTINIADDEENIELTGWVDPEKLYSYIDLPDFGPDVLEEMKDQTIVALYGKVPMFVDDEGRWNWLEKLDGLRRRIRNEMRPYLYPESVVIAYGYNINGFFFVEFLEGSGFNMTLTDEMYGVIDKEAKEIGIENVPVIFRISSLPKLDSGRDDEYRPIIGGVKIQYRQGETRYRSTLGFSTKKTDGSDYGYVVAGHLGEGATSVGMGIYQPTHPDYPAGTVAETGGIYADASWVPYGYVAPKIYISDSSSANVDFYSDPAVGLVVCKSGIKTGLTCGTVLEICDTLSQTHGTLYGQARATYDSDSGDSGSPVFFVNLTSGKWGIVGIHWGFIPDYAVFSPTTGVQRDLDVVPLTRADKLPPIAHDSDISNQPDVMHPDTLYEVTAKYYDPDGRANLQLCTLVLSHPSDDIMMGWGEDLKVPVEKSEFINDGDLDVDYTQITGSYEGYQLTWKFKLNDRWPEAENCIDFCVLARDDGGLQSELDCDNTGASFVVNQPDIRQPISSIGFGDVTVGNSPDKTTTIYNDGTATLTINSITRSSGSSDFTYIGPSTPFNIGAGGSRTITVRFAPSSTGSKSANFNVNSNDPDEANVPFSVSGNGVGIPDIRTPISSISFGDVTVGGSSDKTTTIYNDGTDTLTINSITRTSGSSDFTYIGPSTPFNIGAGGSRTITVRFAPSSTGSKSATFNVNSNDPDEANVPFSVSGNGIGESELSYSPTSHDFGDMCEGVTDSTTFELWNSGTGTLTYTLSESCGWVEINPTSGSSTGEHDTITVDIDTTGLSEGSHTCDITINSNDGSGTFTVTVNVVPCEEPVLSYLPTSHDFGDMCEGVTDSTTFELWNSGTDTLTYSLSESCGWVEINPTSGSSTGEHDTITVDIDTTGLSESSHTCDITISSNGGSGTFTTTVNIIPREPILCTDPDPPSHGFGSVLEGQTRDWSFDITNYGAGTLTWNVSDDQSWITVTPISGSTTTETDAVTVTIDTTGLECGITHTGTITVSSNGGSKQGLISVYVPEPGADIWIDPTSLDLTLPTNTIQDYTMRIGNDGEAPLTYVISDTNTLTATATSAQFELSIETAVVALVKSHGHTVKLKPPASITYPISWIPHEISYDDGTAEDAYARTLDGSRWAVRFTPLSYPVDLDIARICLWENWPDVDHETFAVEVYDDDGAGGSPGTLLGTVTTTATAWGWHDVDISGLGITVTSGDFYIAYKQLTDYPNCEGLCIDETDPQGRSWDKYDGEEWTNDSSLVNQGNWMIRCVVDLPEGCSWLDEIPKSGSVPPGGYDEITVTIDTTGLLEGDYNANMYPLQIDW